MVYSPTWMVDFHGTLVGKNTSPMEHLGYENIVHWRIISFRKCLATMVSESFNWGCSPFQMALFMAYTWLRLLVPTPPHPHPENQQKTPRPSKGRGPTTYELGWSSKLVVGHSLHPFENITSLVSGASISASKTSAFEVVWWNCLVDVSNGSSVLEVLLLEETLHHLRWIKLGNLE